VAKHYHPQRDSRGKRGVIREPTVATPLSTWSDPLKVACVVPRGPLPAKLNGIPFVPGSPAEGPDIDEPAFTCAPGLKPAAGVVIEETDGRFWLVAPTNQVGGYAVTFPKGRPVPGATLQQTARCEAWEESGLVVELATFLCDVPRSQSFTRYYRARRMGGTPSAMGWESQAVLLVPRAHLRTVACHPNDQAILDALEVS